MTEDKRPRGRPKSPNPLDVRLPRIRIKPEQLNSYRKKAEEQNLTLSAWIRSVLDEAADEQE